MNLFLIFCICWYITGMVGSIMQMVKYQLYGILDFINLLFLAFFGPLWSIEQFLNRFNFNNLNMRDYVFNNLRDGKLKDLLIKLEREEKNGH